MAQVTAPIDWQTIEDGLFDWFQEQSGLDPQRIIYGNQDAPQPGDYTFAHLNILSGPIQLGGRDEIRYEYDAGAPAGEDLLPRICGLREFVLSCTVHTSLPEANSPALHSRAVMSRIQSSLSAPSVIRAFHSFGVSILDRGTLVDLSGIVNDGYINRTSLDVRLLTAANSEDERTTYIDTIGFTPDTVGGEMTAP